MSVSGQKVALGANAKHYSAGTSAGAPFLDQEHQEFRRLFDQLVDILLSHQFALLLHQPQLQHLGLDLDVIGVSFRAVIAAARAADRK